MKKPMIYVLETADSKPNKKSPPQWVPTGTEEKDIFQKLLIHRIYVGKNTVFEKDCYIEDAVTIGEYCFFGKGSSIGTHTVVENGVIVAPDVSIGRHSVIQKKAILGRRCKIGEFSFISSGTELKDDVFLPPHTVAVGRKTIEKTEKLTAVVSTFKKLESYFGGDAVFVYETNPDPSLENDMTFSEFIKESRIIKLSAVLEKIEKERKLAEISKIIAVLNNIIAVKE